MKTDATRTAKSAYRFGPRSIAVTVVALGAAGFLWWSVRPFVGQRPRPDQPAAHTAEADSAALKTATLLANTSEPLTSVIGRFERSLEESLTSLNGPEAPSIPQRGQLRDQARDRLALYLSPRFEDYADHVERLTGVRPPEREREAWERMARAFAGAAVDPSRVQTRAQFIAGREISRLTSDGGHMTLRKDSGRYSRVENPAHDGADVYAVLLPMRVAAHSRSGEAVPTTVFFVMEFVYTDELGRWRPWRTGLYDPADGGTLLPGPWL